MSNFDIDFMKIILNKKDSERLNMMVDLLFKDKKSLSDKQLNAIALATIRSDVNIEENDLGDLIDFICKTEVYKFSTHSYHESFTNNFINILHNKKMLELAILYLIKKYDKHQISFKSETLKGCLSLSLFNQMFYVFIKDMIKVNSFNHISIISYACSADRGYYICPDKISKKLNSETLFSVFCDFIYFDLEDNFKRIVFKIIHKHIDTIDKWNMAFKNKPDLDLSYAVLLNEYNSDLYNEVLLKNIIPKLKLHNNTYLNQSIISFIDNMILIRNKQNAPISDGEYDIINQYILKSNLEDLKRIFSHFSDDEKQTDRFSSLIKYLTENEERAGALIQVLKYVPKAKAAWFLHSPHKSVKEAVRKAVGG